MCKAIFYKEKAKIKGTFLSSAGLLGLLYQDPKQWFKGEENDGEVSFIEAKISERSEAKKSKNYALADQIREELKARGIILEDSPQGTS